MFNRILILAPHTDDGELGCGGSIAKFIREGKEVFHAVFSDGRPVIEPSIIVNECIESNETLGISVKNLIIEKFSIRQFEKDRQEILDKMIHLQKELNPDLIFLPTSEDLHQDHITIRQEGLRAFKLSSSILGYEMPWNTLRFETSCFIRLTKDDLQKKVDALNCYKSQEERFYFSEQYVRSLASVRGTQIRVQYAESFEVLRWIV